MRVLTFSWEFPPSRNGGLGVACFGLTRELIDAGVEVTFVLPRSQRIKGKAKFIFADQGKTLNVREFSEQLKSYQSAQSLIHYIVGFSKDGKPIIKSRTIVEEAHRFAHQAAIIALEEDFDIIHAHDWTSFLAGVAAKIASGKPLILHVHATSFDQAGGDNVDPQIYKIEKECFEQADKVVAVSELTRQIIIKKHHIAPEKVAVIHNGCDSFEPARYPLALAELKAQGKKIVLYHGRITIQKGVDYFIKAARRVVDVNPNVVFVISGSGDMTNQIIRQVGALRLSNNVIFAGPLWDEERDRIYQAADLLVMPSVSEPFGLVPLEALQHGTPSLISKQSGVSEVLTHSLRADFWDVEEMANKILAIVRYPTMCQQLSTEGKKSLCQFSWQKAADKVKKLYQSLLQYVRV